MLHSPQNVIKHMPVVVTTQLSSNSIGVSIAGQTGRVSSLRVSRAQPKREKERGGQAETPLIGRRWCCQSVSPLGAEPLSSVGALWVGVQCPGQGRPEALGVPASWHGLLARPSGHQPSRLPGAPLWGLPVHGLCRPSAARPPACLLACLPATAATVPLGVPATTATPQSACTDAHIPGASFTIKTAPRPSKSPNLFRKKRKDSMRNAILKNAIPHLAHWAKALNRGI